MAKPAVGGDTKQLNKQPEIYISMIFFVDDISKVRNSFGDAARLVPNVESVGGGKQH